MSGHGRFDKSGSDGVGAHAAATHFLCDTFGERNHTGFGSRVVGLSCIAVHTDHTGHVDDRTTTLAHHDGYTSVREVEGRFEVYVDHGVPLGFAHAEHETIFGDTGVVDENVDLTEIFMHFLHNLSRFFEIGCVGSVGHALNAFGFHLLACGFTVFVDDEVGEGDVCALFCKLKRERLADTAGGTGDESGFSG